MKTKRWLTAALSLVLSVSVCLAPLCGGAVLAEDSIADMQSEKENLAAEAARLESLRSEAATTLEEKMQKKAVLDEAVAVKEQEIAVTTQLIESLDAQIASNSSEITAQEQVIEAREKAIEERFEQLRKRLRALSKSGNLTALQLVMDTDDYVDFLLRNKVAERISESDQTMMDELEAEIAMIHAQKEQLEAVKAQKIEERAPVAALEAELAMQKQELVVLQSEINIIVNELGDTVDGYTQSIEEIESRQAALQNTIDNVMAQIAAEEAARQAEAEQAAGGDDGDYDDYDDEGGQAEPYNPPSISGSMYWPVPDGRVITSSFKFRWGRWHTGIDIACYGDAEGLAIVAAAPGEVVYTCTDGYGDGYGNYMIIDHGYDDYGQRILTLYAHCSAVYVYTGQTVSVGETIGAVGNTGNSDGAHLHFEVRVDGTAVDPVGYGYVSTSGVDVLG